MADAIMTFWNPSATGMLPSKVIHVGIETTTGSVEMQIEYDTRTQGMGVLGIPSLGITNAGGLVKTPLGLVKQVNACLKKAYGNSPNTPVLHVKSFRLYNDRTCYPNKVKDYEIQDLTGIQGLFKALTSGSPSGSQFPAFCTVVNDNAHFYNVYGKEVNPLAGVNVSHGENAFCGSMIANGFKLIL